MILVDNGYNDFEEELNYGSDTQQSLGKFYALYKLGASLYKLMLYIIIYKYTS